MKQNLTLLSVFFFVNVAIGMAEQVRPNVEESVSKLLEKIEALDEKIDRDMEELAAKEVRYVAIVVGAKRMGKSTFINFLAGKQLVAKRKVPGFQVNVDEPVNAVYDEAERKWVGGMAVSHSGKSETEIPTYWYDPVRRIVIYDLPGFRDSSLQNELKNTFTFQKLIRKVSKKYRVKIVFATTLSSLTEPDNVAAFIDAVEPLVTLFSNHLELLPNAFCLVATKCGGAVTGAELKTALTTVVIPAIRDKNRESRAITFLEDVHEAVIVFIPAPRNEGSFLSNNRLPNDQIQGKTEGELLKESILNLFDEMGSLGRVQPFLSPSNDAKAIASTMSSDLNEKIKEYFEKKFFKEISDYCKKQVEEGTEAQSIRSQFADIETHLSRITQVREAFISNIKAVMEKCTAQPFERSLLNKNIGYLDFLAQISNGQATLATYFESWVTLLEPSKKLIHTLKSSPKATHYPSGLLQLSAVFTDVKDLQNELQKKAQENKSVNRIELFVLDTFYFNDDFSAPGICVCLIAPCWKIVGDVRCFSLKGAPGDDGKAIDVASNGADGNPGKPGMPGGNFLGMVLKGTLKNSQALNFDVSGGNGGKGSDGNKGVTGGAGDDAVTAEAGATQGSWVIESGAIHHYKTRGSFGHHHDKEGAVGHFEVSFFLQGNKGQKGGVGGKGGAKGKAGKPGDFKLITLDTIAQIPDTQENALGHNHVERRSGGDGNNGAQGPGGDGGVGGRNAKGTGKKDRKGEEKDHNWVTLSAGIYERNVSHDDANRGPTGDEGDAPDPLNPLVTPALPQISVPENFSRNDCHKSYLEWFEEERKKSELKNFYSAT